MSDGTGHFFKGSHLHRPILLKRDHLPGPGIDWLPYINRDIVISLMMSHHKNVLKFIGCCLDFKSPALVYEYDGHHQLLSDILKNSKEHSSDKDSVSLSWSNRLKLAADVGNALVYLHTAFSTPIIHTNLCTRNIMVDQYGVAKLLDFSFCVSLPPGELQVQLDSVIRVTGLVAPEYITSFIVTEKTDVYTFGSLLLMLIAGMETWQVLDRSFWYKPLKLIILEEEKDTTTKEQLQAVVELAFWCRRKAEDRPNMIDVAKELSRIERSGRLWLARLCSSPEGLSLNCNNFSCFLE